MSHYRPLPDGVTIKRSDYLSEITGEDELGLFATKDLKKGNVWMTHIETDDPYFEDGLIRLPMGGFFNHNSVNPNCKIIHKNGFIFLSTAREIKAGEELTAEYTVYNPEL